MHSTLFACVDPTQLLLCLPLLSLSMGQHSPPLRGTLNKTDHGTHRDGYTHGLQLHIVKFECELFDSLVSTLSNLFHNGGHLCKHK